ECVRIARLEGRPPPRLWPIRRLGTPDDTEIRVDRRDVSMYAASACNPTGLPRASGGRPISIHGPMETHVPMGGRCGRIRADPAALEPEPTPKIRRRRRTDARTTWYPRRTARAVASAPAARFRGVPEPCSWAPLL